MKLKRTMARVSWGIWAWGFVMLLIALATKGNHSLATTSSPGTMPFWLTVVIGGPILAVVYLIWLIEELANPDPPPEDAEPATGWRAYPQSFQAREKQRTIWAMEAFEEKKGRAPTQQEATMFTPPDDPPPRQRPSATWGR